MHDTLGRVRALPVGARFLAEPDMVEGDSVDAAHLRDQFPATHSALTHTAIALFDGARYEWGGGTNWGCDCSGLVQSVFALHGRTLPRDAYQQAECGEAVAVSNLSESASLAAIAEGDLLFFSDRDDKRITHVGIAMDGARMVHSALGRGGVQVEDLQSDEEYVARLRRNFIGARRVGLDP
ncbi:MAG: C40 family peptidase [Phycisphaerae bacterium]|nr:C40 family peptidase [Gemmatimonadaceae bacterium]